MQNYNLLFWEFSFSFLISLILLLRKQKYHPFCFFLFLERFISLAFLTSFIFLIFSDVRDFRKIFLNSIPLCVISSTIAITSARNLSDREKEFIVYESSFSDIIGIMLFDFIILNEVINFFSFLNFFLQIILTAVISVLGTLALIYFIGKIQHHVKFVPIIISLFFIYGASKLLHLPALLFILFFGLSLNNIDKIDFARTKLNITEIEGEVKRFRDIVYEITFWFTLFFSFRSDISSEIGELFNLKSLLLSIIILAFVYGIRYVQLRLSRIPVKPVIFFAPRGLITIVLSENLSQENRIYLSTTHS